jgi:hypothetical protein
MVTLHRLMVWGRVTATAPAVEWQVYTSSLLTDPERLSTQNYVSLDVVCICQLSVLRYRSNSCAGAVTLNSSQHLATR